MITIERAEDAVPLARALVAGGLPLIEITLRSQQAIDAIKAIAEGVPEAHVGAGTVREPGQGKRAVAAGARFIVSPGATTQLLDAAQDWGVPYLPGAATASEIMKSRRARHHLHETVSGRVHRWNPAAEISGGTLSGSRVLSDGWHRFGKCGCVPGATQCGLHRRLLDGAAGRGFRA